MTLQEIASLFNLSPKEELNLTGVCIDSRQVQQGNLFIALRGEVFDGHEFIPAAINNGAVAIVCDHLIRNVNVPQLVVDDTVQALAVIATQHRQKFDCSVVALTGSNGKTTVKEMIAAILPPPALATQGNLNNHIGAPLSVLKLDSQHRYAVFELGANHPGEIAHTVGIVKPQVTLINNIAPAHIEGFGSIDGVAIAKGEIHEGLSAGGTAVINADDAYADFWGPALKDKKVIHFSVTKPCDIHALNVTFNPNNCATFVLVTPNGEANIRLQVPGIHNVSNALAASACAHALGIDVAAISSALNQFSGVKGRMTYRSGKNQSVIIDDTYNANLRSVLAALDVLAQHKGHRIFVFGDMGELGEWTQAHHEEIGLAAKRHGIETLMTCGKHSEHTTRSFGETGKHFSSQSKLVHELVPQLESNTVVLVKGSRSSAMENIVHELT